MRHELYINGICIGITSNCNWNCIYCIAKKNLSINELDLLEQFSKIKYYSKTLWVSGGEPGILSDNFWHQFFEMIDWNIKLCTNGTFIKKYFPKYRDRISELMIHVVPEIDQEINQEILNFIQHEQEIRINYNFVLHKDNIHLLDSFLTKYDYLDFNINIADGTAMPWHKGKYEFALDQKSAREAALILVKHKKYAHYGNSLLLKSLKNQTTLLNKWSEKNVKTIINVPRR